MPEHERKLGPYPLLKPLLIEAAFSTRSITDAVDGVDMGSLHGELLKLRDLVKNSGQRRLVANIAYATESGSLFIPIVPTWGDRDSVFVAREGKRITQQSVEINGQLSIPVMTMSSLGETEGIPMPISLYTLFINQSSASSIPGIMFGSKETVGLFARGPKTPQWSITDALTKTQQWSTIIEDTVEKFSRPNTSEGQESQLRKKAATALYNQVIGMYDLKYFAGNFDSPILTKQPVNAALYKNPS